ncbi:hypothetical protein C8R44DRAFT_738984 [Mycena epipterygia]|nr:hypothetical protein C8R44DRAFT_738984 [Mycena epipterygia]
MPTPDAAAAASATLLALANPAPGPVPVPSAAKCKYDEILDLLGAPPVVIGKQAKRDSLKTKSPLEKLLSLAKYLAHWATPAPSVSSNSMTVPESERAEQKWHVDAFDKMMAKSPDSLDVLREFYKDNKQWSCTVKWFREAAASARQNDTSSLKHKLKYVLSDPRAIPSLHSANLHPSQTATTHTYDPTDTERGLFRSPFLSRVLHHLWTASSSAMDPKERLSPTCSAQAHGQLTMIGPMARVMLSTSDWTTKDRSYETKNARTRPTLKRNLVDCNPELDGHMDRENSNLFSSSGRSITQL